MLFCNRPRDKGISTVHYFFFFAASAFFFFLASAIFFALYAFHAACIGREVRVDKDVTKRGDRRLVSAG